MSYLMSLRLPNNLTERIETYASEHDLTRTAAITTLLECGLSANCGDVTTIENEAPSQPSETLALARIEALESTVAELQTTLSNAGIADVGPKRYLGPICDENHDWNGTGLSRRIKGRGECAECKATSQKKYKAKKRSES